MYIYKNFCIILTQFYINFSWQEHQVNVLYVSFNAWDSQVSAYTPFHFFFTVPLNKGLNQYGCKPGIVILVTWNYANSPFNIWSPFTCACKTCENTGNWFVCLCTASWHLIKYSSNFQTLKILFELSNAQLELKISISVC